MSKFLSLCFALMLIGLIGGAIGFRTVVHMMTGPGPLQQEKLVLIERGSGLNQIALTLEDEGVIRSRFLLILRARMEDQATALKAGEYQFAPGISVAQALNKMAEGDVYKRQVTIPEGLRSAEIVDLLNAEEMLSGEITTIPAEGSLLPDTYAYIRGDDRKTIISRMQQAMNHALQQIWEERAEGLPFESMEEALILASIIEKETGVKQEREKVAGVFTNRLSIGMPLQTDPTVIYAIILRDGSMDRPLLQRDWREVDSPYNTYQNTGLPPGPIANPGMASLRAAVNPQDHNYIFFVADGTGGHAFAETLAAHNRNVAQWRRIQRQQRAE